MPHLVILYTANLEAEADMSTLCRRLADAMLAARDEQGRAVFPPGGVRVLAYPAPHHAVADASAGDGDHAFCWFNLRIARGRSAAVHQALAQSLGAVARAHFAPLLARRRIGLTLQVDEGPEVADAKFGNLHALFSKEDGKP
jgi:5-carboxymethyl-2-hydroxymuconate isomerase